MTNPQVHVFDCPSCGAPLPAAADGLNVVCGFCNAPTTVESGGAAELKARAAREAAEQLFQTLGQPPSWSQQVAVVLANPWVWTLGLPFAFAILLRVSTWPLQLISHGWEAAHHERLLHVSSPGSAWVLEVGGVVVAALLLLGWSLLGKRVDSRRELQAVLAAKPPTTSGGRSSCRNCNAPLVVPAGTLGVRCTSCGADNLLLLPASWITRARAMATTLRVSAQLARERELEGRRRMRSAALWRAPMVVGLLLIISAPAYARRNRAGWSDLRIKPGQQVGVYKLIKHEAHGDPSDELMGLAHCGLLTGKHPVRLDASNWCGPRGGCVLVATFALTRGERLRVDPLELGAGVEARLSLAPAHYLGGNGVLADGFGRPVLRAPLPPVFEAPVELSGWYKLTVVGPAAASVQPCVVPAR